MIVRDATASVADLETLWSEFLQRWPLASLESMSLDQYTGVGNQDTFCYWIESRTDGLGSIWGGSAFKFGVYARRDQSNEPMSNGRLQDATHGWLAKYGATAQEAFLNVRRIIVEIATAAQAGELDLVEQADLGEVTTWKLAFLYQDRANPCIVPIYKRAWLQMLCNLPNKPSCADLQRHLGGLRKNTAVLSYGQELLKKAHAIVAETLTAPKALEYLKADKRFRLIKSPTEKMAGFRLSDGREMALAMDNQTATFYAAQGSWLDLMRQDLGKVREYSADKSRSSSLDANAPNLIEGNPIASFIVPTLAVLDRVCDAYESAGAPPNLVPQVQKQAMTLPESPLNQILFGPPGTGKTYATVSAALAILDPAFLAQHREDRKALKGRFDALAADQRVRFVTFHQSFSYEDFVEGLRATTDEETKQLRYEVLDGVFKSICNTAEALAAPQKVAVASGISVKGRRIWKMSLGDTQGPDAVVYDECLAGNFILLGYGGEVDFSGSTTREAVAEKYRAAGINIEKVQHDYAVTSVLTFVKQMEKGDLVVVTDGNQKFRAIGEIIGDYEFEPHASLEGYSQKRAMRWLRDYTPSVPFTELMRRKFSQMTLYELRPSSIDLERLQRMLNDSPASVSDAWLRLDAVGNSAYVVNKVTAEIVELTKPNGNQISFSRAMLDVLAQGVTTGLITIEDIRSKRAVAKLPGKGLDPFLVNGYQNILALLVEQITAHQTPAPMEAAEKSPKNEARVLIIDEINRGNIARIFGELITLLEPSKRAGADESLEVVLPYSKEHFSVPRNVYIIGTMNTADRSLAGLDVALRRRFVFQEMSPRPELLDEVTVKGMEGLAVGQLLRTMNHRIEALLDRDHCLGHAYFMPLRDEPTIGRLGGIFRNQVLPLLQEYFFDDWQRIQWVLNDHRKPVDLQFVQSNGMNVAELFGNDVNVARDPQSWRINNPAFERAESYRGIVGAVARPGDAGEPGDAGALTS